MKKISSFFKQDLLFTISFFLASVSCLLGSFEPTDIDLKVISSLFGLMLVIKTLERKGLLAFFAEKLVKASLTNRALIRNLTLLSFFSSMILTNDVAILTLLPVFLGIVAKERGFQDKVYGSILIVIAANLGSSSLPFGNPQNLFLFSFYQLSFSQFLNWMLPFLIFSIVILNVLITRVSKEPLKVGYRSNQKLQFRTLLVPLVTMGLMLAAILNLLPYQGVVPLVLLLILIVDVHALKQVDYRLLLTFVFFFIIVGNLSRISYFVDMIQSFFIGKHAVLLGTALLSQVISNVPAAILIAHFTDQTKAVLWGVNIGGLGTLVASLANLIGFKIFILFLPDLKQKFLKHFSILNVFLLVLFIAFFGWLS